MPSPNYYDVTTWPDGDATDDIGQVINSIIADVKRRQSVTEAGGKPGAVIYIPPGDYRLRTQVVIDISFLRIEGSGHGFTSSSIRFNVPEEDWTDLNELWPGGSRVLVDLPPTADGNDAAGAAFYVERHGNPRISSLEFSNFCIDGLHFKPDGSSLKPENTYVNGKSGIHVASANDSFRINGMGFVYLEHALVIHNADALSIHDNFIAECGSCIELKGWGQATKITDNLVGAGFKGYSIYAENHGGMLMTANNIFPRGASSVHLRNVSRSNISNNRLHSFYPGMVILDEASSENLISSNHFLRDHEPWTPFLGVGNGRDDLYGLLRVHGDNNSVIGNHFSAAVGAREIQPAGAKPVIIHLASGVGNRVSDNHVVALDVRTATNDSCFEGQVDALLSTGAAGGLAVTTVRVARESTRNTILDSGTEHQLELDPARNAVRVTPTI